MKAIEKIVIQRLQNPEEIRKEVSEQETETQSGDPDSYLDLDVSVLRDRGGYSAAIMDKSGIRIFDDDVEQQLEQYMLQENEKLIFYRSQVFSDGAIPNDRELEEIKKQVFSSRIDSARTHAPSNSEAGTHMNMALLLIILTAGAAISLVYGKHKKRERERRIADLNNRYDE